MTEEQAMVEEFHRKFEIAVQAVPAEVSEETKRLRVRLIQEEFDEPKESMAAGDLPAKLGDRQIGPLPRSIYREEPQTHRWQRIQVRIREADLLARQLRRSIRRDR